MPYAFDPTGILPANLIVDELHTLTEVNDVTYRIIIPEFAPFYTNNLMVKYNDGVSDTILQEGVDYILCLPYLGASRSIGSMVYGGISFNFSAPSGTLKISYQTLGGEWIADPNYVYEILVNTAYNPRVTVWDVLTNVQEIFPPINHDQLIDYVYDIGDVILKLQEIADAITNRAPHTFVLGVGLDPDRVLITDEDGKIASSHIAVIDLENTITNCILLANRLTAAEAAILDLQTRLAIVESSI